MEDGASIFECPPNSCITHKSDDTPTFEYIFQNEYGSFERIPDCHYLAFV